MALMFNTNKYENNNKEEQQKVFEYIVESVRK
jgi:hypothetical protein